MADPGSLQRGEVAFGWIGGGGTSAAKQEFQCRNCCHYEIRFHVQDYLTGSTGLAHEKCADACEMSPKERKALILLPPASVFSITRGPPPALCSGV